MSVRPSRALKTRALKDRTNQVENQQPAGVAKKQVYAPAFLFFLF